MNSAILDSNILVASRDQDDKWHERARDLLEKLQDRGTTFIFFAVRAAALDPLQKPENRSPEPRKKGEQSNRLHPYKGFTTLSGYGILFQKTEEGLSK